MFDKLVIFIDASGVLCDTPVGLLEVLQNVRNSYY